MAIQYPVRAVKPGEHLLAHIRDASDRVIAGGMNPEDADEVARALNAYAAAPSPRARAKKQKIEEQLRASDLTGHDRTDIIYGPHDALPQCGEHVARLGRKR